MVFSWFSIDGFFTLPRVRDLSRIEMRVPAQGYEKKKEVQ
jgi:hypothetical protein